MENNILSTLKSRKKWTSEGTTRIQPVETTLEKVHPIINQIGISEMANITDMDRLKIPNYSAGSCREPKITFGSMEARVLLKIMPRPVQSWKVLKGFHHYKEIIQMI